MIEVFIAGAVLVSVIVSIIKDLPGAMKAICQQGKPKCDRCKDRFSCYTNRGGFYTR